MPSAARALAPAEPRGWRDRFVAWRNALLASADFQARALAFAPARLIGRRYARKLFDLCAGFTYTQTLTAVVRLRLHEQLAAGPLLAADLAARLRVPQAALERLLHAATSLELVERAGERYALGSLGAVLLGNPAVAALVEHHSLLYADLVDPLAVLRGAHDTRLRRYWAYAGRGAATLATSDVERYSALMSVSQQLLAADVASAYPIARHRRWLDIGGGDGTFLAALAQRAPELAGTVLDVPPVAALATQRFAAAGLGERLDALPGDVFRTPVPQRHDAVSLVRVLHDHDDAAALAIVRAAAAALLPGGTLLVAEPLATERRREPAAEAYFGWYLLAMGQGHLRTLREIRGLLAAAGLERPRLVRTRNPMVASLVVARRPVARM